MILSTLQRSIVRFNSSLNANRKTTKLEPGTFSLKIREKTNAIYSLDLQ